MPTWQYNFLRLFSSCFIQEFQNNFAADLDLRIVFIFNCVVVLPPFGKVEEMLNEVKFGNYVETGQYETEIDLPTFIKCELFCLWYDTYVFIYGIHSWHLHIYLLSLWRVSGSCMSCVTCNKCVLKPQCWRIAWILRGPILDRVADACFDRR